MQGTDIGRVSAPGRRWVHETMSIGIAAIARKMQTLMTTSTRTIQNWSVSQLREPRNAEGIRDNHEL
jgi:hypothetical protein